MKEILKLTEFESFIYHFHALSIQLRGKTYKPQLRNYYKVPGASDMVAFCAYMSTTEHSPSLHHTFVFDDVRTNIGSAYDRISGIFSAPLDGVYVLTWTMISDYHAYVYSQIVVNTEVFTGLITNSDEVGDRHSSTGVIVVHLNHNDKVYIRTHPTAHGSGNVHSGDFDGKPSFSGWKL